MNRALSLLAALALAAVALAQSASTSVGVAVPQYLVINVAATHQEILYHDLGADVTAVVLAPLTITIQSNAPAWTLTIEHRGRIVVLKGSFGQDEPLESELLDALDARDGDLVYLMFRR